MRAVTWLEALRSTLRWRSAAEGKPYDWSEVSLWSWIQPRAEQEQRDTGNARGVPRVIDRMRYQQPKENAEQEDHDWAKKRLMCPALH